MAKCPVVAETISVSEMAELASDRIFSVFGWERHPLTNQNCDCVDKVRHRKQKKSKTHPTDCVFSYIDPYTGRDVFVNTDLKSYKGTTLEAADVAKAVRNLGHSTECANRSEQWKNLFIGRESNSEIIGMLFIYNHDQDYDANFSKRLVDLTPSTFEFLPETFAGVVGPAHVCYLNSIAQDIKALHSDGKLPDKVDRSFFYPHLSRANAVHQHHKSATLQVLLSPLLVLCYEFPSDKQPKNAARRGVYAYYDGKGDSINEFKYLINYFFKYQLASEDTDIFVCCANPHPDAAVNFTNAKVGYAREYWPAHAGREDDCKKQLERINYRNVSNFVMKFEVRELGLRWPE